MEVLCIVAGLGVAWAAIRWGMCWWDPVGADKMAARLRGRATQLRMMAKARAEARQAAQRAEDDCLREWDRQSVAAPGINEEAENAG